MTDPIADMLTRIRNAQAVKARDLTMPHSKFKYNLANFLKKNGWLEAVEVEEGEKFKQLKLTLKYDEKGLPRITNMKRVSKPGQRIYSKAARIPIPRFGFGLTIVSTSKGLMSQKEARLAKVGGEVICQIW